MKAPIRSLSVALAIAAAALASCTFDGSALDARRCNFDGDCPSGATCAAGICTAADDAGVDAQDADDAAVTDAARDTSPDIADALDASDVADTAPDGGCEPGVAVCSADTVVLCMDDGTEVRTRCTTVDACPDEPLGCRCEAGACVPRVCAPGSVRCNGDEIERCDTEGSAWIADRSCAPDVCSAGSCIPAACVPDAVTCVGETVVTCGADGRVAALESCAEVDAYCARSPDGAACAPWACVPGQVACGDAPNEVVACDPTGRRFEPLETCAAGSACVEGICTSGVCLAGSARCSDPFTLLVCDAAGSAYSEVPCASGFYCGEATGAATCVPQVCEPGSTRCATGTAAVQTCNANGSAWGPAEGCTADDLCVDGACTPRVCVPGRRTCNDRVSLSVCAPGGDRLEVVPCPEGAICDGSGASALCRAPTCSPGEVACDGLGGVRTCDASGLTWLPTEACAETFVCVDATCVEAECTAGVTDCADDFTIRRCNDVGAVASLQPCDAGRYCTDGVCLPQVCVPDARSCDDDGTARQCDALGAVDNVIACGDGQRCLEGECVATVCVPSSASCLSAGVARQCNDTGTAFADITCAPSQVCSGGSCLERICVPTASSCADDFTVGVCNGTGTALATSPCGAGTYCDAGRCEVQACAPDTARCTTGFVVATCDARGAREETSVCGIGTRCEAGACVAQVCEPDSAYCVGNDAVRCDASGAGATLIETCTESCRDGACASTFCGDGFLDVARGEQCDDGNAEPCDGCDACRIDRARVISAGDVSAAGRSWVPGASDVTIELWAMVTVPGNLVGVGSPDGHHAALSVDGSGRPVFEVTTSVGARSLIGPATLLDGAWHHIAGVRFEAGRLALYVDGVAVGFAPDRPAAGTFDGDGRIWIGSEGTRDAAGASIDEVRISSSARYVGGFAPARRPAVDGSAVASFSCDTDGDVLLDATGAASITLSGSSFEAGACYGAVPGSVTCGDGVRAPWEACDGTTGCNASCVRPCAASRGPQGTCWVPDNGFSNWAGAQSSCVGAGGDLVTIDNSVEQAWLETYYLGNDVWIGLNDRDTEGSFVWASGSAATYRSWRAGEPSGGIFADCVVARSSDAGWVDVGCLELHRSLCERPAR